MKTLKLFSLLAIIAVIVFTSTKLNNESELDFIIQGQDLAQIESFEKFDQSTMTVLVVFYKKTTEAEKQTIRNFYFANGVLENWVVCDKNPKAETWEVNCGVPGFACKNGNPPIKKDKPIPGSTERVIPNADCDDL